VEVASNMNVILIDGDELARLMVQYRVGVEERKKYSIYSVDTEYFDE
jgi:restriction system protein